MSKSLEILKQNSRKTDNPLRRLFQLNTAPNQGVTHYTRPIGLELELEGTNLPVAIPRYNQAPSQWTAVNEGSLRDGGKEYILTEPCALEDTRPLLDLLFKRFEDIGVRLNLTNRCSTHVHINSTDMKVNEQTSFVCLWLTFEEALINWCGRDRVGNLFCLSNKNTNGLVSERWLNALRKGSMRFSNDYKYSALNFGNYNRLGTFEIRCLRAGHSPEFVETWVKFLYELKKQAQSTYRDPAIIGRDLSEFGPDTMFENICKSAGIPSFYKEVVENPENRNFTDSCFEGFRECQSIIYEFDWADVLEDVYKQYIPDPFSSKGKKKKNTIGDQVDEFLRMNNEAGIQEAPMPVAPRVNGIRQGGVGLINRANRNVEFNENQQRWLVMDDNGNIIND